MIGPPIQIHCKLLFISFIFIQFFLKIILTLLDKNLKLGTENWETLDKFGFLESFKKALRY